MTSNSLATFVVLLRDLPVGVSTVPSSDEISVFTLLTPYPCILRVFIYCRFTHTHENSVSFAKLRVLIHLPSHAVHMYISSWGLLSCKKYNLCLCDQTEVTFIKKLSKIIYWLFRDFSFCVQIYYN